MASKSVARIVEQSIQLSAAPRPPDVQSVTDLEEIGAWLGTFQERLRAAKLEDRERLRDDLSRWTVRYQQRRAELA
jgi:hypothetical protein